MTVVSSGTVLNLANDSSIASCSSESSNITLMGLLRHRSISENMLLESLQQLLLLLLLPLHLLLLVPFLFNSSLLKTKTFDRRFSMFICMFEYK